MYFFQIFVRDSKLSFSKRKTDIDSSRSWRLADSAREASQTPNLYDLPGAKKCVVWKYF